MTEKSDLDFTILSRDGTSLQVEFKNPWDDSSISKTINAPIDADGAIDKDALREIIFAQARGVKNRMEAARSKSEAVEAELDDLVGITEI